MKGGRPKSLSDPLAVPKAQQELRRRGHDEATIRRITFDNPLRFLSQSGRFGVARGTTP